MRNFTKFLLLFAVMLCFAETSPAQDIIVLNNDTVDELEVKVVEVSDSEVRYKKWSYQDGPIFTIATDKIFVIKYQNGDKQRFDVAPKAKVSKTQQSKNKKNKVKSPKNKSTQPKGNKKSKQNRVSQKTYKTKGINPVIVRSTSNKSVETVSKLTSTPVKVKRTPVAKSSNNTENLFVKGYNTGGIRATYYFVDTEYADTRISSLDIELLNGFYVINNVYAGGGLGVGSSYTTGYGDDENYSITLPLMTGFTIPLGYNFCFDLSTGPHMRYIVAGKNNDVKYKDLPDNIKPNRFGANWDFMAKINFGGYVSIGGMYSIAINKSNNNANGVWGLSLTLGF